jgi:hypothetical protein
VKNGGKLLLSGKMPESLDCLGKPLLKKTWPPRHSMYIRIRPEDKAILAKDGLKDFDLAQIRGDFYEYESVSDSPGMLRLIHDVMYGPPEKCYYKSVSDIPGLWTHSYGNGRASILPFQIGAMYREWGNLSHPMIAVGTLDNVLGTKRRLNVSTSPLVEVNHRIDPGKRFEWIALYNHSGRLENSFHPPIPIDNVIIKLNTARAVRQIKSLVNGSQLIEKRTRSDEIQTVLPRLNVFDIVVIEYAN